MRLNEIGFFVPVVHYQLETTHAASKLYGLVNDITSYHEFVPFCTNGQVLKRGESWLEASLQFTVSGFSHSFTTRNTMVDNQEIDIELVDGPFKHLDGKWTFQSLETGGSIVSLDMDFEVAGVLSYLFEPIFYQISHSLVDVFAARADQLYENE